MHVCIPLRGTIVDQGTEAMKKYHAAVGTESQKYVATIFEVYAEVQRLRDNLREQHRIWIDFYASVFKVKLSYNKHIVRWLAYRHSTMILTRSGVTICTDWTQGCRTFMQLIWCLACLPSSG